MVDDGANKMDRIERILDAEWDAAKSDANRSYLRDAFESHSLNSEDRPVLVTKLSENAVDDVLWVTEGVDGSVLAYGKSWVLFGDVHGVKGVYSNLSTLEDRRLDFALCNITVDVTPHMEKFVESSISKAYKILGKKLQAAIKG
jgi:hypothetical protein